MTVTSLSQQLAENYSNWTFVKQYVQKKLLPMHRIDAERHIWEPYLDLAIVYECRLEDEEGLSAGIRMEREHLKMWSVSMDDVKRAADKNMQGKLTFLSMKDMMRKLIGTQPDWIREDQPLYVMSNECNSYGAAAITDPDYLKGVGEKLQCDYYILPSSVHECLAVPCSVSFDAEMLRRMVCEVNETQVPEGEVLGNCVYFYERGSKEIRIAI